MVDKERIARVNELVEQLRPLLAEEGELIESGTLAVLVAGFIGSHPEEQRKVQLAIFIASVNDMIPVEAALRGPRADG